MNHDPTQSRVLLSGSAARAEIPRSRSHRSRLAVFFRWRNADMEQEVQLQNPPGDAISTVLFSPSVSDASVLLVSSWDSVSVCGNVRCVWLLPAPFG
jgi:hypothetical protein